MNETTTDAPDEAPKYYIDIRAFDEQQRSFRTLAQSRLCPSCKKKLGTEVQERVPTVDPKSGRVVFEMRAVPYASNPLSVIRTDCSKRRDYITPETPVLEAIFRVFLANGNQPSDISSIREQLANYISLSDRPHGFAPELLERLIKSDTFYGLSELQIE